ncbi:MAG: DUF309 domain-containing protein [Acidobacteria bacterium]|uniref:DUF309 domain-containing protein n=1 Tax=Candidatus Polarisedimenticola svalbardensis TaxID=2886004 RepID=A0A8J6XXJ9_9BACT|nr:DUF309 domain-containing protein [Candidatus Polarisedimenticola svalbardensis]
MTSPPLRYTERPLPAYRFIPGRRPHPTRSPRGHSYHTPEIPGSLDPAEWMACEKYLFAVDLFNNHYFWEAHEALEPLWLDAGRDSHAGRFLQGLIKVSAALLKHSMGNMEGAVSHAAGGGALLCGAGGVFLGIDGADLAARVIAFITGESGEPPAIDLQR